MKLSESPERSFWYLSPSSFLEEAIRLFLSLKSIELTTMTLTARYLLWSFYRQVHMAGDATQRQLLPSAFFPQLVDTINHSFWWHDLPLLTLWLAIPSTLSQSKLPVVVLCRPFQCCSSPCARFCPWFSTGDYFVSLLSLSCPRSTALWTFGNICSHFWLSQPGRGVGWDGECSQHLVSGDQGYC